MTLFDIFDCEIVEKIILLLGDTAASRQSIPDAIYNEIQMRNENVNNEVVIYTYALGPSK